MFRVKSIDKFSPEGYKTLHSEERRERVKFALGLIDEEESFLVDSFLVDKGHKNGAEIHNIYDNGIILIYNNGTHKFITALIGRPGQYVRYYKETKRFGDIDPYTRDMCRWHQDQGYNYD